MTYAELLTHLGLRGKTEQDLFFWYALSEVQGLKDMSDEELAELLVTGIKYDRNTVKGHWDSLDQETKSDYLVYMNDFWNQNDSRN